MRFHTRTSHNTTLVAIASTEVPLRNSVRKAVTTHHQAGFTTEMCTGDNILTARSPLSAASILLEISSWKVLPSVLLTHKSTSRSSLDSVSSRSLPPKIRKSLLGLLHSLGEIFSITGDGANDGHMLNCQRWVFYQYLRGHFQEWVFHRNHLDWYVPRLCVLKCSDTNSGPQRFPVRFSSLCSLVVPPSKSFAFPVPSGHLLSALFNSHPMYSYLAT